MGNFDRLTASLLCIIVLILAGCASNEKPQGSGAINLPANVLDYRAVPDSAADRSPLAFSDQGAWFAYALPDTPAFYGGFSGPFLMTQENGKWCSRMLSQLTLFDSESGKEIAWDNFSASQNSFNSHLEQVYENGRLRISQKLFFSSPHSAVVITEIENVSDQSMALQPRWSGTVFLDGLTLSEQNNSIVVRSAKSPATGFIQVPGHTPAEVRLSEDGYRLALDGFQLPTGSSHQLLLTQSFVFPEYDLTAEQRHIAGLAENAQQQLQKRITQKQRQLAVLSDNKSDRWKSDTYQTLLVKTVLTLQNNWRIAAGELKHSGLFPSYHYVWFHGFWAWDSWKHAVALARYDTNLAKQQIKAMFDFQQDNGFIADCVYRDTTIENHNYRNSKPPLSAWAVWEVYQQDGDKNFLAELYPKIIKQHLWWYAERDHDGDGICEYGSTDGSLIAAKWESGMDNAVRFDDSKVLKNSESAWSLNQESVDLNAYLYAEKHYLAKIAAVLGKESDQQKLLAEAITLKAAIQKQFFDPESGWFYDTSIDGKTFIDVMGCEGWLPLWAGAATEDQAMAVRQNMMNPDYFFTKVPLQTLSAAHPKFEPDGGYWRGPVWLDQAYFGVAGLFRYGFDQDAIAATHKLLHNADGLLAEGPSIRENYHPLSGAGLESESFSWSAAHYLLLLLEAPASVSTDIAK